jgi:hypothetical protein
MRVCQFRHDGNRIYLAAAARKPPNQEDQPFYSTDATHPVKPAIEVSSASVREMSMRGQPPLGCPVERSSTGFPWAGKLPATKPKAESRSPKPEARSPKPEARSPYPSFAVIEIFAFSTFDTGHPFSAASAYF